MLKRSLAPALLAGLIVTLTPVRAQISPGPLAEPHSQLEGSRNCMKCHTRGEGVESDKCLSCHEQLQRQIGRNIGLHAAPGYDTCETCHIDHHGRDFELVFWGDRGTDGFDHELSGYTLKGAHSDLNCRDCHLSKNIADPLTLTEASKDLDRTFLGLQQECSSCHDDLHQGQFGSASCESCHGADLWIPASGFNHDLAAFVLTGVHKQIECASCHKLEDSVAGDPMTRFKPVAHQQCSSCHADPHEGGLGRDCAGCHRTSSWSAIQGFDHSQTGFPLTGRHKKVTCSGCHHMELGKRKFSGLNHSSCTDCHPDIHENRFGSDCQTCHATSDWAAIPPGAFDHGRTKYPLQGAHTSVECSSCHRPGETLKIANFESCSTCHQDTHLGQFEDLDSNPGCATCHTVEAFLPAHFSLADHQSGRFPLTGLHQAVPCTACHQEAVVKRTNGQVIGKARRFLMQDRTCTACHRDPHQGTVDNWLNQDGCTSCHATEGWDGSTYSHATTEFPLEGAHSSVPCSRCHLEESVVFATQVEGQHPLRFTGSPTACASCHQDIHNTQFDDRGDGCQSCHISTTWQDLVFDHDRDSRFSLEGAHAQAACTSCHQAPSLGEAIIYSPLTTSCEGCHQTRP